MNKLKSIFKTIIMGIIVLNMQSCNPRSESTDSEIITSPEERYSCTMHPEITGTKGDSCSICGMELMPTGVDEHNGHGH